MMDAKTRRDAMVRKETLLNTLLTALIAALLCGVIFHWNSPIAALAPPVGGILGIWPGTFNFTFLVTLGLTVVTRGRVRRQLYPRLAPHEKHLGASLPGNIFLRAALLAALLTATLAGATTLLFWIALRLGAVSLDWPFIAMLLFYVVYFSALSWLVTPVIIWRALAD